MTLPHGGLVSRALRRAMALLDGALTGAQCRELVKGEKPSDIRAELRKYGELLGKITPTEKPAQKGASG